MEDILTVSSNLQIQNDETEGGLRGDSDSQMKNIKCFSEDCDTIKVIYFSSIFKVFAIMMYTFLNVT